MELLLDKDLRNRTKNMSYFLILYLVYVKMTV